MKIKCNDAILRRGCCGERTKLELKGMVKVGRFSDK